MAEVDLDAAYCPARAGAIVVEHRLGGQVPDRASTAVDENELRRGRRRAPLAQTRTGSAPLRTRAARTRSSSRSGSENHIRNGFICVMVDEVVAGAFARTMCVP